MADQRFPIRFGAMKALLSLLGTGPSRSTLAVEDGELVVRMGWAFRLRAPIDTVFRVQHDEARWWLGIGVHGMFGTWQINGALGSIVTIELDPPGRGRFASLIPVKVKRLHVSVEDPDAVVAALTRETT